MNVEKWKSVELFLHDLGYNFFNIPKLTYPEINALAQAFNKREKKKANAQRKAQRLNKSKGAKRR